MLPHFYNAAAACPLFAADKQKDEDTLRRANLVLVQKMLDSNNISPTLLSKADCVLILPNVKKFGFGGSGGRGPLLCRSGENFEGKWSAPAIRRLEKQKRPNLCDCLRPKKRKRGAEMFVKFGDALFFMESVRP